MQNAILILEDGTRFVGTGFGAEKVSIGEVVFHTGMTGYQEILTDPSYAGQMVTMTYPHIGNYGINAEDVESEKPHIRGFIVRKVTEKPSNYRSNENLHQYLVRHQIPGIQNIDTRALTRHIRKFGSMTGILSTEQSRPEYLLRKLQRESENLKYDLVQSVTRSSTIRWDEPISQKWYSESLLNSERSRRRIIAYDFGIKHNILRLLATLGMDVTVVPASTQAAFVLDNKPDGVFLSNGPGNPEAVHYAIHAVKEIAGKLPLFGICLGHQIIGLALGAKTFKLKFGHHGSNHPVMNLQDGTVEITSQNHNYSVDSASLDRAGFQLTHQNLNDHTVEGMCHRELPVYSVQYHPEASPGPHDSIYLFKKFIEMMENK